LKKTIVASIIALHVTQPVLAHDSSEVQYKFKSGQTKVVYPVRAADCKRNFPSARTVQKNIKWRTKKAGKFSLLPFNPNGGRSGNGTTMSNACGGFVPALPLAYTAPTGFKGVVAVEVFGTKFHIHVD